MILSNTSIHAALDSGALIIDPEPSPRFPEGEGRSCPYQTSSVDLHLGSEIAWLEEGKLPIQMDLRTGGLASLFAQNATTRVITADSPFSLRPHHFVLGKTLERVGLPLMDPGPCLAARVEGRSSYARCGLLVHFTAPTIHAGFEGTITLEMLNMGPYTIMLYPESPICQLIVEQVEGNPFKRASQFQGQTRPGGSIG